MLLRASSFKKFRVICIDVGQSELWDYSCAVRPSLDNCVCLKSLLSKHNCCFTTVEANANREI